MTGGLFVTADPYQTDVLALPVSDAAIEDPLEGRRAATLDRAFTGEGGGGLLVEEPFCFRVEGLEGRSPIDLSAPAAGHGASAAATGGKGQESDKREGRSEHLGTLQWYDFP